ncbi:CpaF family protein [Candidatus Woesearchaeota archaeon]|nr:CpaF family protein [Candidatus Woesearchaeota archaeon]
MPRIDKKKERNRKEQILKKKVVSKPMLNKIGRDQKTGKFTKKGEIPNENQKILKGTIKNNKTEKKKLFKQKLIKKTKLDPTEILKKPTLKNVPKVETYEISSDEMKLSVTITGGEKTTKTYVLNKPVLGVATRAFLEEIKLDLVSKVNISSSEILDTKETENIKRKFREQSKVLLKQKLPSLDDTTTKVLVSILIQEMLGLGEVEFLLSDENIEEIVLNSTTEPIRIFHKKYGWLETNLKPISEPQIHNYSNIIARRVGRQITTLNPLLDAHLITGDRSNAVLFPISSKGNTITIRKFARDPWTMTDLIRNRTCTSEIFALIWICIQYELSILISGGTGSGKTTFLNVCMPFIPPNNRVISIEDTRELQLPKFLFWCPLTTREPNPEGKGKIDMLDLLVNSLRMRPDRIILGEMRKKDQAEVLFEAMHTGHSVYSTVHADSSAETIRRLVNPPIEVPPNLLSGVNLNVVMFRDRRKGIRRVHQIGEFVDAEGEIISVKPNIIYRWRSDTDEVVLYNTPLKLFEDLCTYTGMTLNEIKQDISKKKEILDWMAKKNIRKVEEVGGIIKDYYLNPEELLKRIKK